MKVSKKESEFDRYERMRKLEREAEAEKRRACGEIKKKGGRPKHIMANTGSKNWAKEYEMAYEESREY